MVLVRYWDLISRLVKSDLKLRYKNSVLGFFWTLLDPLLMVLVLLLVFTKLFGYELPQYPSYLLIGLIAWNYFSDTTSSVISLFKDKAYLIRKIYFPKSVLIFSHVLFKLIDFLLKLIIVVVLLAVLFFVKDWPLITISPMLLMLVLLIVLETLLIVGVSYILSSSFVFVSDVQYVWRALLQIGFFITPIFYPISIIPVKYHMMFYLNPMYHLIEMFRNIIIFGSFPDWYYTFIVILICFIFFVLGFIIFKQYEDTIAENV